MLLCLHCGTETEARDDLVACPRCGDSQHTPANLDDSVTIHISTHELRVLTMWATNWAGRIESRHPGSVAAVSTIIDRLTPQVTSAVALTLTQEIADIAAAFPGAEIRVIP